ncbi:putative conserved protein YkwD, contains CAP (CSP/antigen 5/PR1) domain [Abditibacterium utsteinense]|uniref:Putative conserved protein YkwD, contains CAP (CSP/antigen 5/PR1) domain n=1 Tax=Abditibacterium utsteinense TaxID=1960156 RepID=A0A2S8SRQ1_9BACT|nr:CAP domain-containing protein [Abditibacterium utsteinense]PQV63467.1 putative conserved protein YkwD, contains CAP (CSP/antigen 5/PR1) domain [Abditibacterium utsteinense]
MKKIIPALVLGAVLGGAHFARTQTVSDVMALSDYRAALDQITSGKTQNARVLLEQSFSRGEIAPESATLLAYLEERAGEPEKARQVLQGVSTPTNLTSAYLGRLEGNSGALETARRAPQSNAATLEKSDARIEKLEKLMFQIVNNERSGRGLSTLNYDERMASVARAHSAEMRDKKYFAHESPTARLRDPLDRYIAGIGHTPRLVAENIYRVWGSRSSLTEPAIRDAHKALMDSPGHRSNLLQTGATKIGIGISSNANGDLWLTQLFARD